MKLRSIRWSPKWLILGFLCLMIPLFQNMSPTEDFQDIRTFAPLKPEGLWDRPGTELVPPDFHGQSLQDVQQSFLSHNFDPWLKDLELTYVRGGASRFEAGAGSNGAEESSPSGQWQVRLVNPSRLRFSYESFTQKFKILCEAQSGQQGLSLKMTRPLSSKWDLGITHETSLRQSQVQVDYRW